MMDFWWRVLSFWPFFVSDTRISISVKLLKNINVDSVSGVHLTCAPCPGRMELGLPQCGCTWCKSATSVKGWSLGTHSCLSKLLLSDWLYFIGKLTVVNQEMHPTKCPFVHNFTQIFPWITLTELGQGEVTIIQGSVNFTHKLDL